MASYCEKDTCVTGKDEPSACSRKGLSCGASSGSPPVKLMSLPSGEIWEYIDLDECEAMYKEIFEGEVYLKYGIQLSAGDLVFDVGCNIGLFSLFCGTRYKDIDVIGFEPVPPIAEVACRNYSHFEEYFPGSTFQLIRCGLGRSGHGVTDSFTYFPDFPGESTRFEAERNDQRLKLLQSIRESDIDFVAENGERLAKFQSQASFQKFACPMSSISQIIESANFHNDGIHIKLLKIDAEGDELNVLHGIGPHWHLIQQTVLEVHDIDDRLNQIVQLLKTNGLCNVSCVKQTVNCNEEGYIQFVPKELDLFYVYATR